MPASSTPTGAKSDGPLSPFFGERAYYAASAAEVVSGKTPAMRELSPPDPALLAVLSERLAQADDSQWDWPEDFAANGNKTKRSLTRVNHMIFRFSDKSVAGAFYWDLSRWAAWRDDLLPLMQQVVAPLGYVRPFFPRVMLARLQPGALIPPHVDGDPSKHQAHKIHVPLTTNADCWFLVGERRWHFEPGRAYEVNNGDYHGVANSGDSDRVHLIFECLDADRQPWLSAPSGEPEALK